MIDCEIAKTQQIYIICTYIIGEGENTKLKEIGEERREGEREIGLERAEATSSAIVSWLQW